MKHIPLQPNPNPEGLRNARRTDLSWGDFSTSDDGRLLRQAKGEEQQGLCGYCECRLHDETGTLPKGVAHIDHFLPRHSHPELIFDWDNMILSCMRKDTCGTCKERAEGLLNPHEHDPRSFIAFIQEKSSNFSIRAHPVSDLLKEDRERSLKTIEVLNLNHKDLMEMRGLALLSVKAGIDWLVAELSAAVSLDDSEQKNKYSTGMKELLLELESKEFSSAILAYVKGQFHPFITPSQD